LSDVFDEIISRLKQKAKTFHEMQNKYYQLYNKMSKAIISSSDEETAIRIYRDYLYKEQWVGLEDVKEAIQQIKRDYYLVPRKKQYYRRRRR